MNIAKIKDYRIGNKKECMRADIEKKRINKKEQFIKTNTSDVSAIRDTALERSSGVVETINLKLLHLLSSDFGILVYIKLQVKSLSPSYPHL